MAKRILIFTNHFYPEQFKINEIVDWLSVDKCHIRVITGFPNYPNGKIYKEVAVDSLYKYPLKNESMQDYRKRLKSKGFVNGVKAESIRAPRTPLTFWQVIGILAIIWLVAMIVVLSTVLAEF